MSNLQIINETPLTMAELKERLDDVKKRDKELTDKANKTHDYLNKFATLKAREALKLKEEIMKLNIPRIKEKQVIKVIDVMPKDIESLKLVFAAENITIKQEDLQKILDIIK
ncbi:MAG: hypothetical protein AABW56_05510 [Nanoarchaeota archaeon]